MATHDHFNRKISKSCKKRVGFEQYVPDALGGNLATVDECGLVRMISGPGKGALGSKYNPRTWTLSPNRR